MKTRWEDRVRLLDRVSASLAVAALTMVVLRIGFPDRPIPLGVRTLWAGLLPAGFFLESLGRLLWAPDPWRHLARHPFRYLVLLVILLELSGVSALQKSAGPHGAGPSMIASEIYLLIMLLGFAGHWIRGLLVANRWLANLRLPVTLLPALTFGIGILLGAVLLLLPGMHREPITPMDALFTSCSAVCVTGLSVIEVGQALTTPGQFVLALLIQLGGLGIMTTLGMLVFWHGGAISWGERVAFAELLGAGSVRQTRRLFSRIARLALAIELSGALILWLAWRERIEHALPLALFHAVSAFCNAGFCLFPNSLGSFAGDPVTLLTLATLIIAGGLGFPALADGARALRSRMVPGQENQSVGHTSRIVVVTSVTLLLAGTAAFLLDGWIAGRDRSALLAFFQSATARTAGFQTESQIDFAGLGFWATVVLMFIGASPQSTGGGVKTTIIASLATAASRLRPRTGPQKSADRTAAVRLALLCTLTYVFLGAGGTILLILLDSAPWRDSLFEAFSALGTVGLSRDLTMALGTPARAVLVLLMFAGRVLFPTLVIHLARKRSVAGAGDWA